MILKFCEGLLIKIRERQVVVAERLTSGSCHSFEEYKQQIGKLQGLREAEEAIKQVYEATVGLKNLEGVMEDVDSSPAELY